MKDFVVLGLSHEHTPVHIREKCSVETRQLEKSLALLHRFHSLSAVLLSTCNRCELYFYGDKEECKAAEQFFEELSGFSKDMLSEHLFCKSGNEAVEYLFAVVSGLKSQVLGEKEILGQVRKAYQAALGVGHLYPELRALFDQALSLGKVVRTKTGIHVGSASLSSIALDWAKTQTAHTSPLHIAVLGAGAFGEQVLRESRRRFDEAELYCISHLQDVAEEMAKSCEAQAIHFSKLHTLLPQLDVLFCASASPHRILDTALMDEARAQRSPKQRLLHIIDFGMPRNVAPEVRQRTDVRLMDMDDLKLVVDESLSLRQLAVPEVKRYCHEAVEALEMKLKRLRRAPLARALLEQAESLRREQVELFLQCCSDISDDHKVHFEEFSKKLTRQLLHGPLRQIHKTSEVQNLEVFFQGIFDSYRSLGDVTMKSLAEDGK